MRMYVASICCNIAQSHWLNPAKWMYGHLLDGDIASNYLSWQWVAGAFSNKKYYANQSNINKYFYSSQDRTFLDVDYTDFEKLEIPNKLIETIDFKLKTDLSSFNRNTVESNKTTLIYNYYNLDPNWHSSEDYQRILLLEPSFFNSYPVNEKCIKFALELSDNISNIKVFIGEFSELNQLIGTNKIIYKEHPTNNHYKGIKEEREWLSSVQGYYPSFFSFWKKCKKEIKNKLKN